MCVFTTRLTMMGTVTVAATTIFWTFAAASGEELERQNRLGSSSFRPVHHAADSGAVNVEESTFWERELGGKAASMSMTMSKKSRKGSKAKKGKGHKERNRYLADEVDMEETFFWNRELEENASMSMSMQPNRYQSIIVMENTCTGSGNTVTFPFNQIILDWSTFRELTSETGPSSYAQTGDLVDYTMSLRDVTGNTIYEDLIIIDSVVQEITDPGFGIPDQPREVGFNLLRPSTTIPPDSNSGGSPFAISNQQEFRSDSFPGNEVNGPIYNPTFGVGSSTVTVRVYEDQGVTNLPCSIISISTNTINA